MAKRYYPDSEQRNPFRKLDWRWQRADRLVAERRPFLPHRDDAATGRCMAYIRDRQRGGGLPRRHHDLHAAHAVHVAGGDRRVVLEAMILAGASDAEIAPAVGLTPAAVAAFANSFFDVRDLVAKRATDWITIRACGHTPGSPSVATPAILLRLLGYFCGPFVLEQATPFLVGGHDVWGDCLPAGMDTEMGRSIRRTLRLYLLPDTPDTRGRVLRATAIVIAAEARADVADVEGILFGQDGGSAQTPQGRRSAPPTATTPVGRTAAAASLLHNAEGAVNGMGDEETHDEDVLLLGPSGGAEGREGVPRVRGSGTGCRPTGGRAASRAEAGGPGGAGPAGSDPAGRSPARQAVRGGDDPGRGDVVRGRIQATKQARMEEVA